MRSKYKIFHIKKLYIFFIILSLNIFFFSTIKLNAKAFEVKNIERKLMNYFAPNTTKGFDDVVNNFNDL